MRKIAIESREDDLDAARQGSKPNHHNILTRKADWILDLSQDNALNLPMIWNLNKSNVCPNSFSTDSSTRSTQSSQPTQSGNSSTMDSIRLERKCLRDKLRALKALQPDTREEKQRLKDERRWIRLKLEESAHYREAGSST